MSNSPLTPGIVPHRLAADRIAANFADHEAPLDRHEARVAADRCYFCHDAPCMTACPTSIDIPLFIRQIATGTPESAAKTIWNQNILGGMWIFSFSSSCLSWNWKVKICFTLKSS